MEYDFGMVGLGTMGRNLLLNLADHGASVAGFDLDPQKAAALETEGAGRNVKGFTDIGAFAASIRKPRAMMMLVPAGAPVDAVIASLQGHVESGDLLIDGGNSYFKDTDRRVKELEAKGIGFFGMGVSGGEEGARHGPSMMAGGPAAYYDRVKDLLDSVAAKAEDGSPCVGLLGSGAAGHYIKMVHNGIEYAIMQMIAEVYDILHRGAGMDNGAIADLVASYKGTPIDGFLLDITSVVLRKKEDGRYLVDLIQDAAKQKGTGKWTSQEAMDLHVPVPTIDAAVSARDLSGMKAQRESADRAFGKAAPQVEAGIQDAVQEALQVAITVSYAQGLEMLRVASETYGYEIKVPQVAGVWRAGCIIRSALLSEITRVFTAAPTLPNLMIDSAVAQNLKSKRPALAKLVGAAQSAGVPCAALGASLAYLDAYSTGRLPANLIQAQRDFFGAHTYERIDKPGVFHTEWQK